jgi:hypothetical protein
MYRDVSYGDETFGDETNGDVTYAWLRRPPAGFCRKGMSDQRQTRGLGRALVGRVPLHGKDGAGDSLVHGKKF